MTSLFLSDRYPTAPRNDVAVLVRAGPHPHRSGADGCDVAL